MPATVVMSEVEIEAARLKRRRMARRWRKRSHVMGRVGGDVDSGEGVGLVAEVVPEVIVDSGRRDTRAGVVICVRTRNEGLGAAVEADRLAREVA